MDVVVRLVCVFVYILCYMCMYGVEDIVVCMLFEFRCDYLELYIKVFVVVLFMFSIDGCMLDDGLFIVLCVFVVSNVNVCDKYIDFLCIYINRFVD